MKRSTPLQGGLLCAALLAAWGCKPPERYHWGQYESSLYQLSKDPSSLERYGEGLRVQIQRGEEGRRVPPGIYAEYGYFLLVSRRGAEAVICFRKEKEAWPESAVLMDRMVRLAEASVQRGEKG